jgi:hypothetical protein
MTWSVHREHVGLLQARQKSLGDHRAQLVELLGDTATELQIFLCMYRQVQKILVLTHYQAGLVHRFGSVSNFEFAEQRFSP